MKPAIHSLLACLVLLSFFGAPAPAGSPIPPGAEIPPVSTNLSQINFTPAPSIPAPPGSGPRPTLSLSTSHAYMGQVVTASGQGVAPYPAVRLSWLYEESTHTAAVVPLGAGGGYSQEIPVPDDLPPGGYQICASVTGADLAELECTAFTVDPAPPGSVSGSIPLDAPGAPSTFFRSIFTPRALNAFALLRSPTGSLVASATVQPNGTYHVANVPAGSYSLSVVGETPLPLQETQVSVLPGHDVQIGSLEIARLTYCADEPLAKVVAIQQVLATLNGLTERDHLGLYIRNGPSVMVTFTASLNGNNGAVQRVDFYYKEENGAEHFLGSDNDPLYQVTFDVSQLPETGSGFKQGKLIARPVVTGDACPESDWAYVNTIGSPLDAPYLDGSLTWDAANQRYAIVGVFNDYPGQPITYPDPPEEIPLLGEAFTNSVHGKVVMFQGSLALDGSVHLVLVRLKREATLLNKDFLSQTEDTLWQTDFATQSTNLQDRIETKAFFTLGDRDDFSISVPVFAMPFGVPYLFELRFSIAIGIHGGLRYQGDLYPWLGEVDAYLFPSVGPHMTFTVELTLLIFFSGGADLTGALDIIIPAHLNNTHSPPVALEDPCFYWLVSGEVYTSVFWQRDTVWTGDFFDYESEPGCSGLTARRPAARSPAAASTRWMASPEIATAPGGSMLATYVDNVTPQAAVPALKVMARVWNSATGAWGSAIPLSDGIHMVHDPVAAWVGTTGAAMVAWTQNALATPEEAGGDLKTAMARSEIYYAVLGPSGWSAPQRLTNDLLPDGFPALAGADAGVTLAWVRDLDGDFTTRTDWRIFYNHWEAAAQTWGTAQSVPNPGVMHAQPGISRYDAHGIDFTIVYTVDPDGDLATPDRKIQWFTCFMEGCAVSDLPGLSQTADTPAIINLPGSTPLVYLVQEGGPGTLSEIRIASGYDVYGNWVWAHVPVEDENGNPVYGESPRLARDALGNIVLLFRRFGVPGSDSALGQLSYTYLTFTVGGYHAGPILPITQDTDVHWQAALGFQEVGNQMVVLNVRRPSPAQDTLQSSRFSPGPGSSRVAVARLSAGGDALESLIIPNLPDPALKPELELSVAHALPGSSVVVTATVTNQGRQYTDPLTVQLRANDAVSGALLGQAVYPGNIAPGAVWEPTFTLTAGTGQQPLYAVLTTTGDELSTANNQAYGELGEIPPPSMLQINRLEGALVALQVSWTAPDVPGIAGYRVLRGAWPSGPFELVGETARTSFIDWPVQRGVAYAYIVQAYDASGVRSAYSPAMPGYISLLSIYLPIMQR